jgi:prefoldin alpha subunit
MAGSQVDLSQLNIKELQGLHQRLSTEVANLTSSAVALQETAARFATAGQSIEYLQEQKQGQSVLLPLTESLYVSGSLESVERVLVEVGTGYYVEVRRAQCR